MRLIIVAFFISSICFSQQSINSEQFFSIGLSRLQQTEKPVSEKVTFPWIDQYEFRTETHDFDMGKQEYLFRLTPSTAKIRKAQKAYLEELMNAPDVEGQEIYCDHLLSLYIDWLSLYMLKENESVVDELVIIFNDKQIIYESMVASMEFDPEKLLKLQAEKSDIELALNRIKLERDYLLHKYNIHDQQIDFGNFATVEAISAFLTDTIFPSRNEIEFVDWKTKYEKELLSKEIKLESSEKKQLIDFIQLKYNGPHSDLLQERLSIGLGFQLSSSGAKKLKMQELLIEKEELNRKSERYTQEKLGKLITLENKLQSDIQAFFHFQKIMKEERTQLQILSNKIAQKETASPIFLLEVEERHLSLKRKSLKKKEDLLREYLKYLHQVGRLCQSEFVNYLNL